MSCIVSIQVQGSQICATYLWSIILLMIIRRRKKHIVHLWEARMSGFFRMQAIIVRQFFIEKKASTLRLSLNHLTSSLKWWTNAKSSFRKGGLRLRFLSASDEKSIEFFFEMSLDIQSFLGTYLKWKTPSIKFLLWKCHQVRKKILHGGKLEDAMKLTSWAWMS